MTQKLRMQKIEKSEAKINWKDSARMIIAKINAFHPNRGHGLN